MKHCNYPDCDLWLTNVSFTGIVGAKDLYKLGGILYTEHAPQISIIIPIYNTQRFLHATLNAILAQTFTDYECILVNDGSTDDSYKIMQEFAEKDARFILLSQENQGISGARNTALKIARGEYLSFIDSDDLPQPKMLQMLYEAAVNNGADISYCNYYTMRAQTGKILFRSMLRRNMVRTNPQAVRLLLHDTVIRFYVWNKLYKRSIFDDHGIIFPKMYFEDITTTPRAFFYANKVAFVKEHLYCYMKHPGSVLGSMYSADKIDDYIESIGFLRNFFEKENSYKPYKTALTLYGIRTVFCNLYTIFLMHSKNKNFKGFFRNFFTSIKVIASYLSKNFEPVENWNYDRETMIDPKKTKLSGK